MADYIDRQAALNALCDNCDTVQAACPHFPCKRYTSIEALPSADTDEVVRCKNCKWYDSPEQMCLREDMVMCSDDYCGFGERKDD